MNKFNVGIKGISAFQQVELEPCTGSDWLDTSAKKWADFAFPASAITDRVLVTVLSVYQSTNNGFIEVELTGKPGICTLTLNWHQMGSKTLSRDNICIDCITRPRGSHSMVLTSDEELVLCHHLPKMFGKLVDLWSWLPGLLRQQGDIDPMILISKTINLIACLFCIDLSNKFTDIFYMPACENCVRKLYS